MYGLSAEPWCYYNHTNLPEANVELKVNLWVCLKCGFFPPVLNSASSFPKLTDFLNFFTFIVGLLFSPDVFS